MEGPLHTVQSDIFFPEGIEWYLWGGWGWGNHSEVGLASSPVSPTYIELLVCNPSSLNGLTITVSVFSPNLVHTLRNISVNCISFHCLCPVHIHKNGWITWGIIVRRLRKSCKPILEMLTPSMVMLPPAASMMRNRPSVREDFPAPVLPTIPIWR